MGRLAPTDDIDLAWHTHQLSGPRYRAETIHLLGSLLDHDDSPDILSQEEATKETASAWENRFGTTYRDNCGDSYCMPGECDSSLTPPKRTF